MVRWMRLAAIGTLVISLVILGVGIGLFLVANGSWVPLHVHSWLSDVFGQHDIELWLPALIAGWLVSVLAVAGLVVWSMFYVWRRRQYEALIDKLESELSVLRNLPFTSPAPLEDIHEYPSEEAALILQEGERRRIRS